MGLSDLKKELKKLSKDNLVELIADLYKKNKSVREFLDLYADPNEKDLFPKYKEKVFEAFYPKRGDSLKLSEGKRAISDFKKLDPSPELISDIMLFYVETGVTFTNEFGDIDEAFYSSLEKTYAAALDLMEKNELLENFADRARRVVNNASEVGWGFYDGLCAIYARFYDDSIYDEDDE